MHATLTASPAFAHAQNAIRSLSLGGTVHVADRTAVESEALLQGGKSVEISHNGFIYRLQATRLGKLILTK